MTVKKSNSDLEDLEKLQNKGEVVKVNGEDIHIKPFTFGQLLKALKHLSNIGNSFTTGENLDDTSALLRVFSYHTEDVMGLLILATGKDKEFFENLDPEIGIDLAMAAWRVNQDFFAQKLAPKIQQMQELSDSPENKPKQKAASKTGSTSSKN
jgi:hypothetical protein